MVSIAQPLYILPTNPSVKWLATQERNLNRELPYPDAAAETPEEYVSRTYLQFLWLPQSIMPLQFLIRALMRVSATAASPSPSPSEAEASAPSPAAHPLHSLLKPILLTSRAASQKYQTRIRRLLLEENEPADPEEEYMWYAYHKDKIGSDDQQEHGQDQTQEAEYEAHERLKNSWLEKFERREVQIQILLHLLLLSLPGERAAAPALAEADSLPLPPSLSPSKPKRRKRKERERERAEEPPLPPLEERLESYMDKMAMWQLMQSVDSSLDRGQATNGSKGKEKATDGRDWMQAFCEDVVEPLFKEKLPELCALFRSKLFPDAGNSDSDSLLLSPPLSPKPPTKRAKSSAATTGSSKGTSSATAAKGNGKDKGKETDLRSRSRSLSMSLEQEKRERSRSLSIGPNGLRKRATMFEVTMTTKFSKARAAAKKAELERTASIPAPGPSLSRTQSQRSTAGEGEGDRSTKATTAAKAASMGSVLVAATPVKPKRTLTRNMKSQSQSQSQSQSLARIPALFANATAGKSASSSSRTQSQLQVANSSELSRVDSLNIDTDDDDDDADHLATPTKARRQRTHSVVTEDGEGDEWKLRDSSPDLLTLGAAGSQEWFSSGDEGPPVSSSPADLGGFGDAHTPVRAGSARARILVGETPTKPR
ncbi:DNA replication regulator SLD3-domain-containing protein [Cerioporus squamosus]|nr:DNA replication regulator SLD3-domain-containing protein [Cerioporus squamosus]